MSVELGMDVAGAPCEWCGRCCEYLGGGPKCGLFRVADKLKPQHLVHM
jgi:hypothetical protein